MPTSGAERLPAAGEPATPRTTLLRGGRVHAPADPRATAILVAGDTVQWVGSDAAAESFAADEIVELRGALVTPAFVDAHVHATATGLALDGLDLSAARSLAEALDAVERAARAARGRVVLGTGWDEDGWPERRPPTAAELDRASYGGVIYLALATAEPGPDVVGYWAALGDVMTPARLDVRGAGGDLCCDGTLGSRTAALSAPYADDATTTGVLRHNAADVAAHVLATVAAGLQPGFHVIGDAAVASTWAA